MEEEKCKLCPAKEYIIEEESKTIIEKNLNVQNITFLHKNLSQTNNGVRKELTTKNNFVWKILMRGVYEEVMSEVKLTMGERQRNHLKFLKIFKKNLKNLSR